MLCGCAAAAGGRAAVKDVEGLLKAIRRIMSLAEEIEHPDLRVRKGKLLSWLGGAIERLRVLAEADFSGRWVQEVLVAVNVFTLITRYIAMGPKERPADSLLAVEPAASYTHLPLEELAGEVL